MKPTTSEVSSPSRVTVLGAGYSGLTTAAELTLRGFNVDVVAADLGYRPPLTIVGTQSRRWPGSAVSNETFGNDDLLDRELFTLSRLIAICAKNGDAATGVAVVPALKVSKEENNTWNRRPLDEIRLQAASEVQRNLRSVASPARVAQADIDAFFAAGYASVDETQVVKIETEKYFRFLLDTVTEGGGTVQLGVNLTAKGVEEMKQSRHVVNCLGLHAGSVGGGSGDYYSNPGEVVIWRRCPRDFGFYVMDDDVSAGVMQMPDGSLYLSTAAKDGPDQTKNTLADCDDVCKALFGETLALGNGDGYESWKTDRPMRKEGFNIAANRNSRGMVSVENSGHGGAGVAASWACASRATDCLVEKLGGKAW